MSISDAIEVALSQLAANKLRALLTMLGVIIGVGSVIALTAVGQGSQRQISRQTYSLGTNLLFIRPGSSNSGGLRGGEGSARTLSSKDATDIANQVSHVTAVAPELDVPSQVLARGENTFTRVNGVMPDYTGALDLNISEGRFLTDDEVTRSARVAVLGSAVAAQLFPDSDALGQNVRVARGARNTISLQVIGVLQSKGGNARSSADDRMFVPLSLVQHAVSSFFGPRAGALVSQITVQFASSKDEAQVDRDVSQLLLFNHRVSQPDFTVETQDDLAAAARKSAQALTVLLSAIAAISLIVGGIGIMNIMLVTERTHEIGIRKAVGARPSDIMTQFLTEAVAVTSLGGLLGIAAGVIGARVLSGHSIPGLGSNIVTVISWPDVGLAFVFAAGVGLFFGLYPAARASKLRPIDVLRYE